MPVCLVCQVLFLLSQEGTGVNVMPMSPQACFHHCPTHLPFCLFQREKFRIFVFCLFVNTLSFNLGYRRSCLSLFFFLFLGHGTVFFHKNRRYILTSAYAKAQNRETLVEICHDNETSRQKHERIAYPRTKSAHACHACLYKT